VELKNNPALKSKIDVYFRDLRNDLLVKLEEADENAFRYLQGSLAIIKLLKKQFDL